MCHFVDFHNFVEDPATAVCKLDKHNSHFHVYIRPFRLYIMCLDMLGNETLLPSNGFKVASINWIFVGTKAYKFIGAHYSPNCPF